MEAAKTKLSEIVSSLSLVLRKQIANRMKKPLINKRSTEWIKFYGLGRKVDPNITLTRQAALNLALKTIIYETIRDHYNLEKLDENNILNLRKMINKLYETSKMEALAETLLDDLIGDQYSAIKPFLKQLNECIHEMRSTEDDIIGKVYQEIVPQEERRKPGQFWTPSYISDFMVRWSIKDKNCFFLDPALGSGIFVLNALRILVDQGARLNDAGQSLYGMDISPICVLMSTANVLIRVPEIRPNFFVRDFLELTKLNMPFNLTFDSIVCNPPYSRHHELDPTYKRKMADKIRSMTGLKISGLCSSFVYFFINAAQFLGRKARMAFITPYEAFEAFYSVPLKEFIAERLVLKALILFDEDQFAFPGVETAASITLVEGADASRSDVKFIKVRNWPGAQNLIEVVEKSDIKGTFSWGHVNVMPYSIVKVREKWTTYTNFETPRIHSPFTVPLRELARIMRGIATGANDFFVLTDEEVKKWGIEREFLRPVITRTREVQKCVLCHEDLRRLGRTGKKRWLFYCALSPEALEKTKALKYIEYGERLGYPNRSLIKSRKRWYELEKRDIPPIIFTYLTRGNARFIYNTANALALNVFLLIYPIDEIANDEIKLKALLAYLNSDISRRMLRTVGRTYGGKTLKLEPRELDILPALDVRKLDRGKLKELAKLFEGLCGSETDAFRARIDKAVMKLLQVNSIV